MSFKVSVITPFTEYPAPSVCPSSLTLLNLVHSYSQIFQSAVPVLKIFLFLIQASLMWREELQPLYQLFIANLSFFSLSNIFLQSDVLLFTSWFHKKSDTTRTYILKHGKTRKPFKIGL
jgi:hypothetical protein